MSYTPHTWVNNETITAAKLNNIEDGVQEAAQSGGGYDAVFKGNTYASNYDVAYVSGDYAAVVAKLKNLEPVNILYYEEFSSGYGIAIGFVTIVETNLDGDYVFIVINGGGTEHSGTLAWLSDNTVAWD